MKPNRSYGRSRKCLLARWALLAFTLGFARITTGEEPAEGPILIQNRHSFSVEQLPAERVPIGVADDYKPCIARLPSGELHIVAFHQHMLEGGKVREDMIRFRSSDGGRTWSQEEPLDLLGREPYYSLLQDGTMFITTHLLESDVRNPDGYVHSYLHRSIDQGKTWTTLRIGPSDVPGAAANAWTHTSRNVLELADGTLILGVSVPGGANYLWRSRDKGETWDKSLACEFEGVEKPKLWWPLMAETLFWQAPNGDLLAIKRVDPKLFPPLPGTEAPQENSDQFERLLVYRSTDGGAQWTPAEPLGSYYGEMYPALLRLADRRLLLTFTVREVRPPLGVQALLGEELPDGFHFDFKRDRLVLDARTPQGQPSGGGFGPTVQLDDGTLVTAYSYRDGAGKTHLESVRWELP